jgi:hypothetical protein
MQAARAAIAVDPKLFGKGRVRVVDDDHPQRAAVGDDLKLFATTFLAGFVVVSVLIA